MKLRLLIAATAALAVLGASAADAGHRKHKRHHVYRHHAPIVVYGAPAWHRGYGAYLDPSSGRSRPAWAGPNQCFTDEGYGRFSPCDMGRGRF